ncbi:MAG: L-carnitine dehydrogenase [Alphaproteobacteria bacterium MarineAlpha11_Bin1]|nr:MAG: L-carnitine dehydrogenase [Alphaproteobacteria bacterium MarineAlpha11_Bin1]|tara:strand:- start:5040 stop:5525 length:486 start_codon:yes stop_codon:yes gene_type:complete
MIESDGLPEIWRETVRPEWCDYNNHLNMSFYVLIFDHATDVFHANLGLDKTYRVKANCSTFAVETHTNYLAEMHDGDEVSVTTQLLDFDQKRLHYFHRMYHAEKRFLAATTEVMTVHVDLGERKVTPMAEDILAKVEALFQDHRSLPPPDLAGRHMGIVRK